MISRMATTKKIISCDSCPDDYLKISTLDDGTTYIAIGVAPDTPPGIYLESPTKLKALAAIFTEAAEAAEKKVNENG